MGRPSGCRSCRSHRHPKALRQPRFGDSQEGFVLSGLAQNPESLSPPGKVACGQSHDVCQGVLACCQQLQGLKAAVGDSFSGVVEVVVVLSLTLRLHVGGFSPAWLRARWCPWGA